MTTLRAPVKPEEFTQYYQLRWQILRKPWHQAAGSEQDGHEQGSIHRMIIDENNEILAVGRLEHHSSFTGQIRYMAVSPTAQKQGLGKQIINALETVARQLGMTEIMLNAREAAIGFYNKLGYQQHELSHVLFDEIKHYRMTKKVSCHPEHKVEMATDLVDVWHETIPMSKAMDLRVSYFDSNQLITQCDAQFNKNLHNTMFAGSIYTLATLTGWGWVYLALKENPATIKGDIVLAKADIRYHLPIQGIAYAKVVEANVSGSVESLSKGKKARINVLAHVYCGDNIAATFTGCYVIITK